MDDLKTLFLIRLTDTGKGTFGALHFHDEAPFAVTLEPPWKNNETDVSCIPTGEYICGRVMSPHFGNTFEILDVPGRVKVVFHKGNTVADTHACVLVGEDFRDFGAEPGIGESRHGYEEFMAKLKDVDKFRLIIKEVKPISYSRKSSPAVSGVLAVKK